MTSLPRYIVPGSAVVVFFIWTLGTILHQLRILAGLAAKVQIKKLTFWKRYDVLNLCPNLAFFSRLPSVQYHFLTRDHLPNGDYTAWCLLTRPKDSVVWALWNPRRRKHFAVDDACRSLVFHLRREFDGTATPDPFCPAFLFLLHFASVQTSPSPNATRQFMVAASSVKAAVRPLFVSPLFQTDFDTGSRQRV